MAEINQHIIKHALVEMQFKGMEIGPEQQSEIRAWVDRLMELIERDFDALAPKETYVSIDTLSVELNVGADAWKETAIKGIAHEIKDQVQLQSRGVLSHGGYKEKSPEAHFRAVFLSFLQFGYLPWHTKPLQPKSWIQAKEKLFNSDEPLLLEALWTGIQQDANFRKRLQAEVGWQALVSFLERHLKHLGDEDQKLVEDAVLFNNSTTHKKVDTLAYQVFFASANRDLALLKRASSSISDGPSLARRMLGQIVETSFKSKGYKSIQAWAAQMVAKEKLPEHKKSLRREANNEDLGKQVSKPVSSHIDLGAREGIYISNAGLVIIAAFLPAFFTKLGFWKNGEWVRQDSAVASIQFLATSSPSFEEYDLVLPKLLCGITPEQFVETKSFKPGKEIKTEVEALLASVIEHWSILKETSAEGLQASFLQRDGKLIATDDAWMLWVEQKPFDMLLQHLPWNMTMIKLPWMDQMLKTEWIY